MFGEKAYSLIKELSRVEDSLPPYNMDLVNEVINEIKLLKDKNFQDAQVTDDSRLTDGILNYSSIKIRHTAVRRNIRCLLAYHYNRLRCLRTMRWEFGSILPAEIKVNLSAAEIEWFSKYSRSLAQYMRSIGEEGVNLAVDLKPPKSLYIEVRCLADYGKYELNDGLVLFLKKDSRHYLPRHECEELIHQGVFQHIV